MKDELERAILDDPDAIAPRMVYADYLAAEGSPLGEWLALQRALAERADITLRTAALAYLQAHTADVLGGGAEMLDGLYLGWHGGFIDEIRFHTTDRIGRGDAVGQFAKLLEHPIAQFVRTISLGTFPEVVMQGLLYLLEEEPPPLLEALVLFDSWDPVTTPRPIPGVDSSDIAGVVQASRLKRLGLSRVHYGPAGAIFKAMPSTLEELVIFGPAELRDFERAKLPNLVELTLLDPRVEFRKLPALPALRRLRLIGMGNQLAERLDRCDDVLGQLELLDISHGQLDDDVSEMVRDVPRVIQKRMQTLPGGTAYHICKGEDPDGDSWLLERLATDGRRGLAVTPHAGVGLYNASCVQNDRKKFDVALVAASAAMTLPDTMIGGWGWGNVGFAHEMLGHDAEAELAAREGLLRHPSAANFHAMLILALRGQERTAEALALIPEALDSVTNETRVEDARDVLVEVVLALVERGESRRAIATAKRKQSMVLPPDARFHAAVALAHVTIGEHDDAKQRLRVAAQLTPDDNADLAVLYHAHAAFELATGNPDRAIAMLGRARQHRGWRFVARDPRFAGIHDDPRFRALL